MRSARQFPFIYYVAAALFGFGLARPAIAPAVEVLWTEPAPGVMPTFGTVPFPNNLYFDGGAPGAGDGTLVNQDGGNPDGYEMFGVEVSVLPTSDRAVMAGIDRLDGFGVTTATWFFFDGPINTDTLPGVDVVNNGRVQTAPSAADTVFLVEVGSGPAEFVPVKFSFDFDVNVPNTLGIVPLEGTVLKPNTDYVAVIQKGLKAASGKLEASADFLAAKGGPILSAAHTYVTGSLGVADGDILGMTVYTTQTTTATLRDIRTGIVDNCTPTIDFTGGLVFTSDTFFGVGVAPSVATVASGYYESPRLQSLDTTASGFRDGSGGFGELDVPSSGFDEVDDEIFIDAGSNGAGCDLTVVGTPDGLPDVVDIDPGTPGVLDMADVPVTLAVPIGAPPVGGWPVIIVQHGLGGHRSTTMSFAEGAAAEGFAVIGIDSVDHGLRFDETDTEINFTGAPGPDGLPDGALGNAVNFGFFEAFSNIAAIRDNFRQTYVDIMALVRALDAEEFDAVAGVDLSATELYYIGLSLGGLIGSGSTPYIPEVRAVVLDAPGGQQSTELFINSTIGSGAFGLLQAIFSLDPNNLNADYSFFSVLTQHVLDAGDGAVSAPHFFTDPFALPFRPMNVILLEDMDDTVVPNQSNESIAVAAGFELFDPHVQNLNATARPLSVVSTPGYVEGNVGGGATTAAVFQVGPAVHAVITEGVSSIALVPGFAHNDEFRNADLQSVYPTLMRPVRIKFEGVLGDVLDWFNDVLTNGEPGRFTYTQADPTHNPAHNVQVGAKAQTLRFFNRTINADGALPYDEATPEAEIGIKGKVAGRVTMSRSTLGTTGDASDFDMPPGATLATPNVLPFFLSLQRADAPAYEGNNLEIVYTDAELAASGCTESDLFIARFNDFTGEYDALPTGVIEADNRVRATGLQGADGVFGVMCAGSGLTFGPHMGAKSLSLVFNKSPQKGKAKASIFDPSGTLVIDPTVSAVDVTIYEDRDTILFQDTMATGCWEAKSATKFSYDPALCGTPGAFSKASLKAKDKDGTTTYSLTLKLEGALAVETLTTGGGGSQLYVSVDGIGYNTSGGRCKFTPGKKITCSKFDD